MAENSVEGIKGKTTAKPRVIVFVTYVRLYVPP